MNNIVTSCESNNNAKSKVRQLVLGWVIKMDAFHQRNNKFGTKNIY